jgi:hypothetical protein
LIKQRLPRGQADHRHRRDVLQRDARRCSRYDLGRRDDEFRGCAWGGHRQERDDGVTNREALNVRAERIDGAGHVDARRVRERHGERPLEIPAADAAIDAVERCCGNANSHLTGARDGILGVLVAQDARVAELVESHCLHVCLTPCRLVVGFAASRRRRH